MKSEAKTKRIGTTLTLIGLGLGLAGGITYKIATDTPDTATQIEQQSSTSVPTHRDRRICINAEMTGDDWPVPQAAEQWNKNGKNIFVVVDSTSVKTERCDGHVILHVEDTGAYWGATQHTGTPTVRLAVSSRVPLDKRLHVLCHELGHVLGLPHFETPGESCMNLGTGAVQLFNPGPTSQDLQEVGRDLWDWDKARQSASR